MSVETMWAPWDEPGLEHLRLVVDGDGRRANGLVLALDDEGRPFRLSYEVRCDAEWRAREVRADVSGSRGGRLHLLGDGAGGWREAAGTSRPALDGCLDIDLTATPFTNTLPIRRLELRPGEAAEIAVAYVDVPSLRFSLDRQRYTRLPDPVHCPTPGAHGASPTGVATYGFEQLTSGFTAELTVDGDGLVLDYPGLFRRVWSG